MLSASPVGPWARVGHATLEIGDQVLTSTAVLTHVRGDLPPGAVGFILRFELGGEILDVETTKLRLTDPDREAPFPAASANLDALIGAATDELFTCVLLGVADGIFAVEDASAQAKIHRRAMGMATHRSFAELTGAAIAPDQAVVFANPTRVQVNGWLADDGKPGTRLYAAVLDETGDMPLTIYREALMRPDLAGAQIRALKVGISSGFLGTARLTRALGPNPVCLVGMIHDGQTVCSLRQVQQMTAADLGGQFDNLRRNLVDADKAGVIFANLLPSLPDHINGSGESVDRPESPAGLAYVLEHDLDHWLGRDAVRLVRSADPGIVQVSLITAEAS